MGELAPLKLEKARFVTAVKEKPHESWGEEGIDAVGEGVGLLLLLLLLLSLSLSFPRSSLISLCSSLSGENSGLVTPLLL